MGFKSTFWGISPVSSVTISIIFFGPLQVIANFFINGAIFFIFRNISFFFENYLFDPKIGFYYVRTFHRLLHLLRLWTPTIFFK
jgi:hypothetical protein